MTSHARRENVEYARVLHNALTGEPQPQRGTRRLLFRMRFVYATLTLLCVTGGIFIILRHGTAPSHFVYVPAVRNTPAAWQEVAVVAFRLSPLLSRSSDTQRTLRTLPGVSVVRLRLDLERMLAGSCELLLSTAEELEVLRMVVPTIERDAFVRAELPASKLPYDDYVLELRRSSSVLAAYSFRVSHY